MNTFRVACAHDCPDGCSLLAHVKEGRIVRVEGDPGNPFTDGFACAKVNRDADLVNSTSRLERPLKRMGAKGSGQFTPISWDEALDTITERWTAIIAKHGPLALLGYAYSAHQGQVNRGLLNGFFHALGSSRLLAGTVCDTCCETAWNMTVGPVAGPDPETVADSDLIVAWSADLMATNVHFWTKVEKARKKGVKVIAIDPRRHKVAERSDWHVQVRVGSDAALALGVMHCMVRDGMYDKDYVAKNTVGFDALCRKVLPDFPPERVAGIAGVPAGDVLRLAKMFGASKKTFLRMGEGMTRNVHGGQAMRAVAVIPGLNGSYGRRGGGAFLYGMAAFDFNYDAIRKPSGPAQTRMINHLRLGEELLTRNDPPIKALFIAANNPAVTCPDTNKLRRALAREDLFTVVHDPFMTRTARYADIVLPAALYLESEDFYRSYGSYYMQYAPAAAKPRGEARSNYSIARELAKRMGLKDAVFQKSPQELVGELFKGAGPLFQSFVGIDLSDKGPIRIEQPDHQVFKTPSGKLEIYSETLASQGLDPLPNWAPEEPEIHHGKQLPLRLLTAPGYFLAHTTFEGVDDLRRREGQPFCVLHPRDAAQRMLKQGDKVRLFNSRGQVGLLLCISDETLAGVVLVPGQRDDTDAVSGTVNMLCSDRFSDMGEGATYQSTWLEVEAWQEVQPAAGSPSLRDGAELTSQLS